MKLKFLCENKNIGRRNAYSVSRMLEHSIRYNPNKELLSHNIFNESVSFEPSDREKGGIIVFSYEFNAVEMSKNKLANWVKQHIETTKNRFSKTKKIDNIAQNHSLVGWTIGKYLNGRYTAKNGNVYGENSLSLEIIGVDTDELFKIASDICKAFKQESALVKDYSTGRVVFIEPDEE